MRLLTEIEPEHRELPDHIELGVRIAGMKIEDARRVQNAAALNSGAVRRFQGREDPEPKMKVGPAVLSATEWHACEQYAYVRFLMEIDDYWVTLPHTTTKQRLDYILQGDYK
jgi:hypothetical protein